MENLSPKNYAHIGDAVWELYVREKIIEKTSNLSKLHKLNISYVNAAFQFDLLMKLDGFFSEKEKEIVRRGRNVQVSSSRRIDQNLHRQATGFEAVVGYLYLCDKERLKELFDFVESIVEF